MALSNVSVVDSNGTRLLDNLSFRMAVGDAVALDGGTTSGAETIVGVLARLEVVDGGRVTLGDTDLKDLPLAVTGRRISYAGIETFFPQGTIEDAMLFGIRHTSLPPAPPGRYDVIKSRGNNLDVNADWVDYAAAGAEGADDIGERMHEAMVAVDLEHDILAFGLNRRIPEMWDEAAERFVEARTILREKLDAAGMTGLVEPFDPEHYNSQSTIGENLIFGTPLDDTFSLRQLGSNPIVRKVLAEHQLDAALFAMGKDIASTILEVFDGLEADSPLFEQLSLMAPDQFADYQAALKRVGSRGFAKAASGDQAVFLDLAFGYIEPRDRLGLLTGDLELSLLDARRAFYDALGEDQQSIAFYHPDLYNEAASVKARRLRHRRGRVAGGGRRAGHDRRTRPAPHRVPHRPVLQHRLGRQAPGRRPAPEAGHGAGAAAPARPAAGAPRADAARPRQPGRHRGPHRGGEPGGCGGPAGLRHPVEPGKRGLGTPLRSRGPDGERQGRVGLGPRRRRGRPPPGRARADARFRVTDARRVRDASLTAGSRKVRGNEP